MNGTKIASKAKAQPANFMGKVFTHFSKPTRRFIEECIYGIQASGDTKLSSIVRAIDDAHNIASDRQLIQISMASCAGIPKPLENRRDDSLRQTVVRL